MIELIPFGKSWLAKAAQATASNLPLFELEQGNSTSQLILVRYAKSQIDRPFDIAEICRQSNGFIAMWADCVTECGWRTKDIAGYEISDKCVALQVIRIGIPDDFVIGDFVYQKNGISPNVARGYLKRAALEENDYLQKCGYEYYIRVNVDRDFFGNIPVEYNKQTAMFDMPSNYTMPALIGGQLPDFKFRA